MCEYCDPTMETDHWVRFGDDRTAAFVSFTGGGGRPKPPELIVRLLLRKDPWQNVTGSYEHRMPVNFCPWCGRDLIGDAVTGFYRFPAMAGLEEWDNADQIEKLKEELKEAIDAYYKNDDVTAFGVELMNVIHTSETGLRMNFNENEAEHLRQLTIEKNRKRGYYGEENGE